MRGSRTGNLLSPRARRVVIFVAFASAVGFLVTLLYGKQLMAPAAGQRDSYGAGPLGHRAFAETFERLGYFVAQNRGARFDGTQSPMLFLEPQEKGRAGGFEHRLEEALASRSEAGLPTLVVLPKWQLAPSPDGVPLLIHDPVASFSVLGALTMPGDLHVVSGTGERRLEGTLGSFRIDVPSLQVFTRIGAYDEVLLDDAEGAVVVRTDTGAIVVSDPDAFHNYDFHRADHAALAFAILQVLGIEDTLVIDETFHGHGVTYSLGEALGEFPAVLLVIQALLLMFLVVMLGSSRFGPPTMDPPMGHGPQEAIAVAASVLSQGRGVSLLAHEYVRELVLDLHSRLGLPEHPSIDEQATRIDQVAQQRGALPRAVLLLARSRALTPKSVANTWALVQDAHAFRTELLAPARRRPTETSPRDRAAPSDREAA